MVEKRYSGNGRERGKLEIFKLRRPLKTIRAGHTLRIIAQQHFRVLWTADDWADSDNVRRARRWAFRDRLPMSPMPPDADGPISFTLFWPDGESLGGPEFRY